jgi:hypothetical protein
MAGGWHTLDLRLIFAYRGSPVSTSGCGKRPGLICKRLKVMRLYNFDMYGAMLSGGPRKRM